MRVIQLRTNCLPSCEAICTRWKYIKYCMRSLTTNVYGSTSDLLFEPIICIVDAATAVFGKVFVALVIALISAVVAIYHMDVIPFLYKSYNYYYASIVSIYGHYLLVLISFHYYKSVRTKPGYPPTDMSERQVTSVCKRCILPKPPRTHHCSVCKRCVLKMDHHCPWINNCVGHYNHRYFVLFCMFMWLGTVFVSTTTWPLFRDCFNVPSKAENSLNSVYGFLGYNQSELAPPKLTSEEKWQKLLQRGKDDVCIGYDVSFKSRIVFLWFLCTAVIFSLGFLTTVHIKLVSFGETTIEQLINKKSRRLARKKGHVFVNPYYYGLKRNWKMLLRFHNWRTFIKYVLLPFPRLPEGSGLEWNLSSVL